MAINYGNPGIWHTPSYQSSGIPWISGSSIANDKVQMMQFPYVARSFTVINTSAANTTYIKVQFQSGSTVTSITRPGTAGEQSATTTADVHTGLHYIEVVGESGSVTFNTKCDKVYIANQSGVAATYQIFAELTNIPASSMWHLTGSGVTDCPGMA